MRAVVGPWAFLLLWAAPSFAWAGAFNVQDANMSAATGEQVIDTFFPPQFHGQGAALAGAFNGVVGTYLQDMAQAVNQSLSAFNLVNFLGAMANAGTGAMKAMPMDYASDPSLFSLTVGGGATATVADTRPLNQLLRGDTSGLNGIVEGQFPAWGVGAHVSMLLGVNLRVFDLPDLGPIQWSRLTLYGSFAGAGTKINGVAVKYLTFGLHGQYRLIQGDYSIAGGILRWGGLIVGTGFGYSAVHANFAFPLPASQQTEDFSYGQEHLVTTLSFAGQAQVDAGISVASIPFEAVTSVQLLYVLTLYAGGALDVNMGLADFVAKATAPLTVTMSRGTQTMTVLQPEATLNFDQSASPTRIDARGFAGLQLNMGVVGLFCQASVDSTHTYGVNAGLRFFW